MASIRVVKRREMAFVRRLAAETLLATAVSVVALALVAQVEGAGPAQPLNATSHWLNGEAAARDRRLGWRTTGVGLATHLAATGFWAVIYELWLQSRRSPIAIVGKALALAMAGVSALVDYRVTPKRFTPGWEFVLTRGGMTAVYLAMAGGFAAAASWRQVEA